MDPQEAEFLLCNDMKLRLAEVMRAKALRNRIERSGIGEGRIVKD